jgi:hypothetical protein
MSAKTKEERFREMTSHLRTNEARAGAIVMGIWAQIRRQERMEREERLRAVASTKPHSVRKEKEHK